MIFFGDSILNHNCRTGNLAFGVRVLGSHLFCKPASQLDLA